MCIVWCHGSVSLNSIMSFITTHWRRSVCRDRQVLTGDAQCSLYTHKHVVITDSNRTWKICDGKWESQDLFVLGEVEDQRRAGILRCWRRPHVDFEVGAVEWQTSVWQIRRHLNKGDRESCNAYPYMLGWARPTMQSAYVSRSNLAIDFNFG